MHVCFDCSLAYSTAVPIFLPLAALITGRKGASGLCGGERGRGISVAGRVKGRLHASSAFVACIAGLLELQASGLAYTPL